LKPRQRPDHAQPSPIRVGNSLFLAQDQDI
jgi:hypothetical protein